MSATTVPEPTPRAGTARSGRGRAARRLTALLGCVLLLGGCHLRLETAPPTEPTPDSAEITREAAVVDVLDIGSMVTDLLADEDQPKKVTRQLERISQFSQTQLTALGGVYDSGLPSSTSDAPTPTPTADDTPPSATAVVSALADAYSRSRAALATVPDAEAARLYASVAASQLSSMRSLAAAAKVDLPDVDTGKGTLTALPAGPTDDEVADLIVGEDSLGYAREILAARLDGDARTAAADQASADRAQASAWAGAAGVRHTDADPRQVLYTFPGGLPPTVKKLRRTIATLGLQQTHRVSALLLEVGVDDRAAVADLLAATYQEAVTDGAQRRPLPGLPEYEAEQQQG